MFKKIFIILVTIIIIAGCSANETQGDIDSNENLQNQSEVTKGLLKINPPSMKKEILNDSKKNVLAWLVEVEKWKINVLSLPSDSFDEFDKKAIEEELEQVFSKEEVTELINLFYSYNVETIKYTKKDINYASLNADWQNEVDIKKLQEEDLFSIIVNSINKNSDVEMSMLFEWIAQNADGNLKFKSFNIKLN